MRQGDEAHEPKTRRAPSDAVAAQPASA
jgi:hypothetical protein